MTARSGGRPGLEQRVVPCAGPFASGGSGRREAMEFGPKESPGLVEDRGLEIDLVRHFSLLPHHRLNPKPCSSVPEASPNRLPLQVAAREKARMKTVGGFFRV